MTEQELYALIADHEADRVEFIVSTTDTNKFAEAVCAFANDLPNHRKPGYLIIGVRNDGTFGGIQVTDELLRNLGGLRDDGNIQPLPAIAVEKVTTRDGQAAVVTCSVPEDYVSRRSYPLFRAREVLEYLAAGGDAGSP
jgi:ATP-dependent DNA helicase RecG